MAIGESDNKLKIVVEVDSASGEAKLNDLNKDLETLEKTAESAGQELATGLIGGVKEFADIAVTATTAASGFVFALGELAEKGEGLQDLRDSFNSLGGNDSALTQTAESLKGLVREVDLLRSANTALLGGIPDFNNNFELLATTAQKLSNTLGIDTTQALDQLVNGLVKAQDKQLQLMGVNVDATAINETYANSIGKEVSELTELEKKQAFQIEALKQISDLNKRLPEEGESVANSYQKVTNTLADLVDQVAIGINNNKELANAFDSVGASLQRVDLEQFISNLAKSGALVVEVGGFLVEKLAGGFDLLDAAVSKASKSLSFAFQLLGQSGLSAELNAFSAGLNSITEFEKKLKEETIEARQKLEMFNDTAKLVADQGLGNLKKATENTRADIDKLQASLKRLNETGANTNNETYKKQAQALADLNVQLQAYENQLKKVGKAPPPVDPGDTKNIKSAEKAIDTYEEAIKELIKQYKQGNFTQEIFLKVLKEIKETAPEAAKAVENMSDKIGDSLKENEKDIDDFSSAIEEGIGDLSNELKNSGDDFNKMLGGLFSAENADGENIASSFIDSYVSGIAEAFNSSTTGLALEGAASGLATQIDDIFKAVAEEDKKKRNEEIGGAIGAVIGAAIGTALGGWGAAGAVIGEVIGSWIGGLFGTGGNLMGQFREDLFTFFNESIKDLNFKSDLLFEDIFRIPDANDASFDKMNLGEILFEITNDQMLNALPPEMWDKFWSDFADKVGQSADETLGKPGASAGAVESLKDFVKEMLAKGMDPASIMLAIQEMDLGEEINNAIDEQLEGNYNRPGDFLYGLLGITGELKKEFEGLAVVFGTAFAGESELLGEVMRQYEAILALNFQNVEGLNELQMIIQGAGMSLQVMEDALNKAFLEGRISQDEYIKGLQAARDLHTQGIPSAIGDTNLAMKNLVEDGMTSGRHAMDAFGDLAAEAMEKGITSTAGLRDELIAQGYAVEQVDILMQAMAQAGITDLEGLKNITVEQTGVMLHWLNNLGFQFDEQNTRMQESNQQTVESQKEVQKQTQEVQQQQIDSNKELSNEIEKTNQQVADSQEAKTKQITKDLQMEWKTTVESLGGVVGVNAKVIDSFIDMGLESGLSIEGIQSALIDMGLLGSEAMQEMSGEMMKSLEDAGLAMQGLEENTAGVVLRMDETGQSIQIAKDKAQELQDALNGVPPKQEVNLVINSEDGQVSNQMQVIVSAFNSGNHINIWEQQAQNNEGQSNKPAGGSI